MTVSDNIVHSGSSMEPSYVGIVYPWHCDHMGHMNVMWYVSKFDEATWTFLHSLGLEPSVLRKQQHGMAAVEQHLTYKCELVAGEGLKIFSRVTKVGEKVIHFTHEMIRTEDGVLAATCTLIGVHTDLRTRKGIAFPEIVIKRAKVSIVQSTKEAS